MTEAEAKEVLQLNMPLVASKEANKAMEIAIKALEKQIAKKPVDKLMYIECPTCEDVGIEDSNYCPYCGQKLDWSEVWL